MCFLIEIEQMLFELQMKNKSIELRHFKNKHPFNANL